MTKPPITPPLYRGGKKARTPPTQPPPSKGGGVGDIKSPPSKEGSVGDVIPPLWKRGGGVNNNVLDFFSPAAKLAVELDGAVHQNDTIHAADTVRDQFLKKRGITVLRFENKLVFTHLEWVLEKIRKYLL